MPTSPENVEITTTNPEKLENIEYKIGFNCAYIAFLPLKLLLPDCHMQTL